MRDYELIRSRRKTLALELTRDGRLIARAPMRLAKREIDRFVAAHEDWILRNLAKQAERPPLPAPDSPETEALKAQAKAALPGRVAYWSKIMGVQPTGHQNYHSAEAVRQLQQQAQPLLFLLSDAKPGGGGGSGGGSRALPYPGDEPRAAVLCPAGTVPARLERAKEVVGNKASAWPQPCAVLFRSFQYGLHGQPAQTHSGHVPPVPGRAGEVQGRDQLPEAAAEEGKS